MPACATCTAPGGYRDSPYCPACYAAALDRVRVQLTGRKPDPVTAPNLVIRHVEPTMTPSGRKDPYDVAELVRRIGAAVKAAGEGPIPRAAIAREVGVAVSSKRMSAAVREAEAGGLIRVVREGSPAARGLYPGAQAGATASR